MPRTKKLIEGSLQEIGTYAEIASGLIAVSLITRLEQMPKFEVEARLEGWHPEIQRRQLLLALREDLVGEVSVAGISPILGTGGTRARLLLVDPLWLRSVDWFYTLS